MIKKFISTKERLTEPSMFIKRYYVVFENNKIKVEFDIVLESITVYNKKTKKEKTYPRGNSNYDKLYKKYVETAPKEIKDIIQKMKTVKFGEKLKMFLDEGFVLEASLNELKGDRSVQHKKIAIKKAQAKKKVKCKGNMTPHLVSSNGNTFKYVCKPKDKKKARIMKKVVKKVNRTQKGKIARKKAQDTRSFRYGK